MHVLETAVQTWTKQIKNVLKLDPEHALKSGTHPGPMAEIDFWNAKSRHLNSIQQQLQVGGGPPRPRTLGAAWPQHARQRRAERPAGGTDGLRAVGPATAR